MELMIIEYIMNWDLNNGTKFISNPKFMIMVLLFNF